VTTDDASAPASSLRGVSKEYPAARVWALADADLDLPKGALTVLLGVNGAGKTTLLRILAGLLAPSAGTVEILGVRQPAGGRLRRELRRRVTYVSQEPALDPEMTGGEILSLLAVLYGVARQERARRIAELAGAFGTTAHMARPVAGWSGGLKRRLHLAAGMIHDPELLLLDEPTAGLDVEGNDFLWAELVRRARDGRAVAVVTHDLAAAERCADRVAIVEAGRIAAAGEPRSLMAERGCATLAELFRRATGRDPAALAPRPRMEKP
jgi:ABC-type multidrug transport system ATPase subunit